MHFSIIATGDSLISQRIPYNDSSALALQKLFLQHDIRFTNFETTVHNFDVYASATSGGTWAAVRPLVLKDLKWLGLNLFAAATNHSLDWGYDGLKSTMKYFKEYDCTYAGIGNNLYEAGMPCYIDTPEGRVALISVTSTGKEWHIAGEQRPDVPGRPGVNMLRFDTVNYLPQEDIDTLKRIIGKTFINARRMQLEREGFQKPIKGFAIGTNKFEVGEPDTKTFCNKKDLARILAQISEARRQADVVIVSHHAHEFKGNDKANAPDYEVEFAHACIDTGVDVFIGHGPHQLRGIEIYKNHPAFYSLGNFFIQSNSIERQPAEFYDKSGLGPQNTPTDGFEQRSHHWTTGQGANILNYISVLPSIRIEDGKVQSVKLYPITLGFDKQISRKGRPQLANEVEGEKILKRLQTLSDPYKTEIEIIKGLGTVSCHR